MDLSSIPITGQVLRTGAAPSRGKGVAQRRQRCIACTIAGRQVLHHDVSDDEKLDTTAKLSSYILLFTQSG